MKCAPYILLLAATAAGCAEFGEEREQPLTEIRISADTVVFDVKNTAELRVADRGEEVTLHGKTSYRGGSSRKYEKRQYSLKLDEVYPLAGLPEAKAFVLNASYIDKTLMRHRLNYDLFRAMHPKNVAPECAYAHLWENEDYRGIYVIMQRINAGLLGLKGKEGAALWKEPMLLYEPEVYEELPDHRYGQKYPDPKKAALDGFLDETRDFLFNAHDSVFAAEVFQRFDRRNIIDWQLLLLFSNNSDGQRKNFYLFRSERDAPLRVAVWDCDHSFGRDGDGEYNMADRPIEEERIILFRRLNALNPDGFREEMSERYAALRRQGLFSSEGIRKMTEGYEAELRPHIDRNVRRWPHDAEWYYDDADFDREIEIIRQYVDVRLPALDERFGYIR